MLHIFLFFYLFIGTAPAETHTLTLTVSNITSVEGTIEIGLFNKNGKFLERGEAFRSISVPVNSASESVVITDLPKGVYAISLYHDKNGNGVCDRNFFGIPKEPYGFSNNFKPKFSAPAFEDCAFTLTSSHSLTISLIN